MSVIELNIPPRMQLTSSANCWLSPIVGAVEQARLLITSPTVVRVLE
jgi:hypothetical protein